MALARSTPSWLRRIFSCLLRTRAGCSIRTWNCCGLNAVTAYRPVVGCFAGRLCRLCDFFWLLHALHGANRQQQKSRLESRRVARESSVDDGWSLIRARAHRRRPCSTNERIFCRELLLAPTSSPWLISLRTTSAARTMRPFFHHRAISEH